MRIAVDIETQPENMDAPDPYTDKILLIGCAYEDGNFEHWKIANGEQPPAKFFQMLEDPDIEVLMHYGSFDTKFLYHNYGVRTRGIKDTFAAERLLTAGSGLKCGLDMVAWRRLGVQLDKSVRNTFAYGLADGEAGKKQIIYLHDDCRFLFAILDQQERELKANGQMFAYGLENELSWLTGNMEYRGIGFDNKLWKKYVPKMRQYRSEAAKAVWDWFGSPYEKDLLTGEYVGGVSLTSRELALKALRRKGILLKDYRRSTLLKYLFTQKRYEDRREVVRQLIEFKKWDKALSWDYDLLVHPITSNIHGSFNSLGTDTGRFSSNNPNLQNVARPYADINFRHLFIAPPGWVYIGADYSQIELRLFGLMAEKSLIEVYKDPDADVHTQAAEFVLERKAEKADRHYGKIVNFGVRCYGGGSHALIESALDYGVLLTVDQADRFCARIKEASPQGEQWGKEITAQMKAQGWLQTPIGHRRILAGEDRETVARNTPIQGMAGGICKSAMVQLNQKFEELYPDDAYIAMQVHDELGVLAKEEIAQEVSVLTKNTMEEAGQEWMGEMPCVVDEPYISNSWQKG